MTPFSDPDEALSTLNVKGVCQMMPQLRGKLQAGETLRITCREAEECLASPKNLACSFVCLPSAFILAVTVSEPNRP